jgi:asparagine synthase (glutamine-hydrolysing)
VKAVLSGEGADECFLGYGWQAPGITIGAQLRRRVARRLGNGPRTPVHLTQFRRGAEHLVTDLHNRFEASLDSATRRRQLGVGDASLQRNGLIQTLDALEYNLRALLHRNDAMGMAHSIEARFPYLDQQLVGLALHLPYRTKRRWDPKSGRALAITDKWVLRRVADRYLPRHLSRRGKLPFTVDAAQRLNVDPRFFYGSMVSDLFGLTERAIEHVMRQAPQPLVLRLLHLDVWMRVCVDLEDREEIRHRLLAHTSFTAAPTRSSR